MAAQTKRNVAVGTTAATTRYGTMEAIAKISGEAGFAIFTLDEQTIT